MAQESVKQDREKYVGGSDIPVILGISSFKKRFDLLLEKAGFQKSEFTGNEYTEYGNVLEPKIRDYINTRSKKPFVEDKLVSGDVRCHVDGWNNKDTILEIKTTSQIHESVNGYKVYLVQLLFYMHHYNVKKGKLAVYERPKDFDEAFDEKRLTIYDIDIKNYKDLLEDILQAVDQFLIDLEKVKENPFITEEELQPKELIELSNKVVELENELAKYKELEKQYKTFKSKLFEAMEENNVKRWTTNNGVKITRVESKSDTLETYDEFNLDKFQKENPDMYTKYIEKKATIKKGKSGYLVITLPEDNK